MGAPDESNRYGWESSAQAWIATVEQDPNRTHLLDPIMLRLAGDVRGVKVLDVGCGEGRFCRMLAARGADCMGIDPVPTLAAAAQSRGGAFAVASGERLPFPDGRFGLVASYLSLIDIPNFRAAIEEMARVCAPGGRILAALVHPMASAVPGWVKDEMGRRLHYRVDRYFEERGEIAAWNGIEVFNWHRSMEAYMDAFLRAGLRLDAFEEPSPEPKAAAERPQIADMLRVPNFVVLGWSKG